MSCATTVHHPRARSSGALDAAAAASARAAFRPEAEPDVITVDLAHTSESRRAANLLLADRYRWRGYAEVCLPPMEGMGHVPLVASQGGEAVGTP